MHRTNLPGEKRPQYCGAESRVFDCFNTKNGVETKGENERNTMHADFNGKLVQILCGWIVETTVRIILTRVLNSMEGLEY